MNIRFNDAHDSDSLIRWMQEELDRVAGEFGISGEMKVKVSARVS